jgi:hypothetical protein
MKPVPSAADSELEPGYGDWLFVLVASTSTTPGVPCFAICATESDAPAAVFET